MIDLQQRTVKFIRNTTIASFVALAAFSYSNSGTTQLVNATNTPIRLAASVNQSVDKQFLQQESQNQQMTLVMAHVALERATHPEVRSLAQSILLSQSTGNKTIQSFYHQWYEQEIPTMDKDQLDGQAEWIRNAHNFDRQWLEEMMIHHADSLKVEQDEVSQTQNPELKSYASQQFAKLQSELGMMKQWNQDWYGQTN
jgi:uncharacterized protein (DUF305 family)